MRRGDSDLPRFLFTRALSLCVLLLAITLALLLRSGRGGAGAWRLYEYAEMFQLSALVAFGGGLLGSLLMEDILRYYGE